MADCAMVVKRRRTTAALSHVEMAVFILIVLAFTFFTAPLLTRSLQIDEASSIWFTRLPWNGFLTSYCDPHPPGYYLLLKGWLGSGIQAIWSRLPSLWAALLAIALTFRLGRHWVNRRTGLLAAALLAFQPLTMWYAAQTRMYALVLFLGVVTFWLASRLWQANGRFRVAQSRRTPLLWFLYWFVASLLLWVDFTGLLVWGLLQLIWLAIGRPHLRGWLLLQTAVFLPFLLLFSLLPATQTLSGGYQPVFVAIQATKLGIQILPDQASKLLLIILALVAILSILSAIVGPRLYRRWPTQISVLITVLLVGSWLFLIFAAAVPRLYTIKRLLVPLLPMLALATAAVTKTWTTRRAVTLVLPGLLVCLIFLPLHPSDAWQTAVLQITKNAPEGARFWVDDMIVPAFAYYIDPQLDEQWDVLYGRSLPQLPDTEPTAPAPLFLVTSKSPYRDLFPLLPSTFHENYQLMEEYSSTGVDIYEFQQRTDGPIDIKSSPLPPFAAEWGLLLNSPLDTCR